MRILVFNGSPKKDKSDTMHIARAFLEGMQEAAPQEIHRIDVIDRHIGQAGGQSVRRKRRDRRGAAG